MFDFFSTGHLYRISWTGPNSHDGWLVLDRNGNGRIDDGTELFGNMTPQPDAPAKLRNGFRALAEYDRASQGGNDDGVIDSRDAVFDRLRLWIDANHNGISEPGELHHLREFDIAAVSLNYKTSPFVDGYGNRFRYRSRILASGNADVGRWAYDVFLLLQK